MIKIFINLVSNVFKTYCYSLKQIDVESIIVLIFHLISLKKTNERY